MTRESSRASLNLAGCVLAGILFAGMAAPAHAQTAPTPQVPAIAVAAAGETQELLLRDGTRALGRVEKVENGRVTFRSTSGALIEVDAAQVVSVKTAAGRVVDNSYWAEDSNPTRLFFAPTGRSLKKGEAYFGDYELIMPFFQVGITDRISIGGGTPLFFGADTELHPFWLTPKVQLLSRKNTQAAAGIIHFISVGNGSLGIAYTVVTQGTADNALTAGLGWAYERSAGDEFGGAVVMLGGERRVSRLVKVVTENYVWDGGGFASGGVRFLGERLSVDIGLVAPLGIDEFFAFPMVDFVWKFQKK